MVYKNINWLSVNKNQMAKNIKLTKNEWLKNKKYTIDYEYWKWLKLKINKK